MKFEYLADHRHFIPTIADWFNKEWKHLNPMRTKEDIINNIETQLSKKNMPLIFIGLNDQNELLGTVTLKISDMEKFEHFTPWLSSLYVPNEKRHQGIGTQLIKQLIENAKESKINLLYLFTEKSESWYTKMGWLTIEKVVHRGYPATIMKFEL